MKTFSPKISQRLLERIVIYLNNQPYQEVVEILNGIHSEVQAQLPKPPISASISPPLPKPRANGHVRAT